MRADVVIVAAVVGLGTWLFRFLPTRLRGRSSAPTPRLTRVMESIGPAAIATLFVASILPGLAPGASHRPLVVLGCAATILVFRISRSVVLATIAGAVAYGVGFGVVGG